MKRSSKSDAFVCDECGADFLRWQGQCTQCNAWNSIQAVRGIREPRGASGRSPTHWAGEQSRTAQPLSEVAKAGPIVRLATGINELDRALGGGLVPGSVVLLGGDPGIGKSTLLLQAAAGLGQAGAGVLYVTGEESLEQVQGRAHRLGLPSERIQGLAETRLETMLDQMESLRPSVVIVDSIQTAYSDAVASAAGGVAQVRECAAHLTRYAKTHHCAVFLVGHVTKGGDLAGPRVLEHLVDAVLYFEGDPQSPHRLVRAIKNRFGAANELGAFEMTETGLVSVDNPSALFLSDDRQAARGACVFVMQDGPRPMLVELQGLVTDTVSAHPKRQTVGLDSNRLAMILAVLHKEGGLATHDLDVFANAVGGVRVTDPGSDLPLLLALLSSISGRPLPADLACFGEIGLTGEVRPVQHGTTRLREAVKLGFAHLVVPARNQPSKPLAGVTVHPVKNLAQALQAVEALSAAPQNKSATAPR